MNIMSFTDNVQPESRIGTKNRSPRLNSGCDLLKTNLEEKRLIVIDLNCMSILLSLLYQTMFQVMISKRFLSHKDLDLF